MLSITVVIRFFPTYRSEIRMIKESLKMRNIRLSFSASAIFGISVSSRSYTCNYDC